MAKDLKIPLKGTRAVIFFHLLDKDSNTIELKKKLNINESAVRRHLDILERDGIISHYFDKYSVGRPKKMYRITQSGKSLLPKKNELLVSLLIRKIASTYGKHALKPLMDGISDDLAEYFLPRAPRRVPENIEKRLKRMVKLFDEFGFFASLSKRGEEYIVTYRNCAFWDVLPELGGQLCEMHRGAVMKILKPWDIKLEKCIARGDNFCSQRIVLAVDNPKNQTP